MKNKGLVFKFRAVLKCAGSGQWKTSCFLSYSLPRALRFPHLLPVPGKAAGRGWEREEPLGNGSVSREREHIRPLHLL